jgi:uncharacterized protein YbjT (DUF2867 family)
MRVILFGGTGMVGQGVLRECLADTGVESILMVVRQATGSTPAKVEEFVRNDFIDWNGVEDKFVGYDACFFCLGVSAIGMKELAYSRLTYDLTINVAEMLVKAGSIKTFVYVSGQGTNANGRQMWARVKGATENTLMKMPFEQVFCFRPGYIQPLHGIRSKIGWYNAFYASLSWMYPALKKVFPGMVTNTEEVGRAMIAAARRGYRTRVLETKDIAELAKIRSSL